MSKFILTKKLNMTQVFTPDGKVVPVTVLKAIPTKVSQIKTRQRDGYEAVQVESGKKRREFRSEAGEYKVGQEIKVSEFEPGEKVNIAGTSKGRGFAGVMKRHGFHGFPASHGHPHQRAPGSIGQAFPQHVRKGKKMAGRMGGKQHTVKSALIVAVEPEQGLLFVKGSVPGSIGGLIKVVTTGKKKEFSGVFEFVEEEKKEAQKPESAQKDIGEVKAEKAPEGKDEEPGSIERKQETVEKVEQKKRSDIVEKKEEDKKDIKAEKPEEEKVNEEGSPSPFVINKGKGLIV